MIFYLITCRIIKLSTVRILYTTNYLYFYFQYHMAPRNNGMMDRTEDPEARDDEDNPENEIRRDLSTRAFNVNRYFLGGEMSLTNENRRIPFLFVDVPLIV